MNDVEDARLHFRGFPSAAGAESWIAAAAEPGHPDWNQGGNYRHQRGTPLAMDEDQEFRLNSWTYDWPRYSEPFYFGRMAHGMTMILMFDRASSSRDEIRFSLYKFKLPKFPRPAWDFQYVVHKVNDEATYGFRGRLVYKPFVSPEDCRQEYLSWKAHLSEDFPPKGK